jgi:hypothetical protein
LKQRRAVFFAVSVTLAGLALTVLCLVPLFVHVAGVRSPFAEQFQERLFFDLIGWISGLWLLSFVSAGCAWRMPAMLSQWLGILLLCVAQALLLGVWNSCPRNLSLLTPALMQVYFIGYFLGLFTMPALTLSGNRTLSGLGTLAMLFPWLLGRPAVVLGMQLLYSAFS